MKDLTGREIRVNDYIAYAVASGRSPGLAIYQVREIADNLIKACALARSYDTHRMITTIEGRRISSRYAKFGKLETGWGYKEMTEEKKLKVDNQLVRLAVPERAFIIDNFNKDVVMEIDNV